MAGPLDRQGASQRGQSGLAGIVGSNVAQRDVRTQRGNVDDSAVAPIHHGSAKYLCSTISAGQIGIEDLLPFGLRHIEERSAGGHTGRIDKNVDFAELLDGGVSQTLE